MKKKIEKLISDNKMSNAIRCGSPVSFYELRKFPNNELINEQEISRFKNTI